MGPGWVAGARAAMSNPFAPTPLPPSPPLRVPCSGSRPAMLRSAALIPIACHIKHACTSSPFSTPATGQTDQPKCDDARQKVGGEYIQLRCDPAAVEVRFLALLPSRTWDRTAMGWKCARAQSARARARAVLAAAVRAGISARRSEAFIGLNTSETRGNCARG